MHRTIGGGVGHNLPQEAPEAFADAIREVGEMGAPRGFDAKSLAG
jgi:hypothetical protein